MQGPEKRDRKGGERNQHSFKDFASVSVWWEHQIW